MSFALNCLTRIAVLGIYVPSERIEFFLAYISQATYDKCTVSVFEVCARDTDI